MHALAGMQAESFQGPRPIPHTERHSVTAPLPERLRQMKMRDDAHHTAASQQDKITRRREEARRDPTAFPARP